jgi:pyruvate dehydrogenase E1 component beta subunit
VAAIIAEEAIDALDAPIVRLGAPFTPVPFSPGLEDPYRVLPAQIAAAAKNMM